MAHAGRPGSMRRAVDDFVLFVNTLVTLTADRGGATRSATDITCRAMVILCDGLAPREGRACSR